MPIYRGVICDHCPKFEKTCKVVLRHPKGMLVLLDHKCEDLTYLVKKNETQKSIGSDKLRKGGIQ